MIMVAATRTALLRSLLTHQGKSSKFLSGPKKKGDKALRSPVGLEKEVPSSQQPQVAISVSIKALSPRVHVAVWYIHLP